MRRRIFLFVLKDFWCRLRVKNADKMSYKMVLKKFKKGHTSHYNRVFFLFVEIVKYNGLTLRKVIDKNEQIRVHDYRQIKRKYTYNNDRH